MRAARLSPRRFSACEELLLRVGEATIAIEVEFIAARGRRRRPDGRPHRGAIDPLEQTSGFEKRPNQIPVHPDTVAGGRSIARTILLLDPQRRMALFDLSFAETTIPVLVPVDELHSIDHGVKHRAQGVAKNLVSASLLRVADQTVTVGIETTTEVSQRFIDVRLDPTLRHLGFRRREDPIPIEIATPELKRFEFTYGINMLDREPLGQDRLKHDQQLSTDLPFSRREPRSVRFNPRAGLLQA